MNIIETDSVSEHINRWRCKNFIQQENSSSL